MSAADLHRPADADDPPTPPRRADFQRWRRHSRLIRVLRQLFPAIMALIVLIMAGWVVWSGMLQAPKAIKQAMGNIHMVNPRFQGRDSKGRAYILSAREAARSPGDEKAVILTEPFIALGEDTATPTRLMAKTGVYREDDRMLHLSGDVRLDDGSGYRFAAQDAVVDTRKGELVGKSAMAADGPMGQVQAGSFAVEDKGKRAIFKGGVRARLNQH